MSPKLSSPLTLVCRDLGPALDLLKTLGARLEAIYPADAPTTAILSHGEAGIRLTTDACAPAPSPEPPPFHPGFLLTRAGGEAGEGRAGMLYRDLIPGRLGGAYVASHIAIPEGGPVADWVHFHEVGFQMIFVRQGWVRVVYEDQGPAFVMQAGDCVLQPPRIRHRVLESSPGLEVVEVGAPALHATLADHELVLPNARFDPGRDFSGQRFLRHVAAEAPWTPFDGFEARDTGMASATGGLAEAVVLRPESARELALPPHPGELLFGFVLAGAATLELQGAHPLGSADAFVVPPGQAWRLSGATDDFQLLKVATARSAMDRPHL